MALLRPLNVGIWHDVQGGHVFGPKEWPFGCIPHIGDTLRVFDGPRYVVRRVDWTIGWEDDPDYVEVIIGVVDE